MHACLHDCPGSGCRRLPPSQRHIPLVCTPHPSFTPPTSRITGTMEKKVRVGSLARSMNWGGGGKGGTRSSQSGRVREAGRASPGSAAGGPGEAAAAAGAAAPQPNLRCHRPVPAHLRRVHGDEGHVEAGQVEQHHHAQGLPVGAREGGQQRGTLLPGGQLVLLVHGLAQHGCRGGAQGRKHTGLQRCGQGRAGLWLALSQQPGSCT